MPETEICSGEHKLREEIRRLEPRLRALSAALACQPELGCREQYAVTLLTGNLEEEGFHVETGLAGLKTAFRATRGGGPGPTIAFLAEYDAVPGLGHACGHHLICAAAYGAAVALARALGDLPGRVMVCGAPAEETIGGKVVLAARGAFEGVDLALLAHPGNEDRALVESLASWSFEVVFEGRAAHAVAAPEEGINALDAAIQLFVAKDALLKALNPEVRIPGIILEGGRRPNVVPDRARARFSLRAAETGYLVDTVVERFRALVEGVSRASRTRATLQPIDNLYDNLVGNPIVAEVYSAHATALGMDLRHGPGRVVGSLDMGTLSHCVPSLHPYFSITGHPIPTHTPGFTAAAQTAGAFQATLRAALALGRTGWSFLRDPALLDQAREAHTRATLNWKRVDAPLVLEQEE